MLHGVCYSHEQHTSLDHSWLERELVGVLRMAVGQCKAGALGVLLVEGRQAEAALGGPVRL